MKKLFLLTTVIIIALTLSACDLNPIINKIKGCGSEKSGQENYTILEDGTYLYDESNGPFNSGIQFKDQDGNVLIDSTEILWVSARRSVYNDYYIQIKLNEQGTVDFAKATRENVGKEISILLDGQVLSSPVVTAEITNGELMINNIEGYEELMSIYKKLVER